LTYPNWTEDVAKAEEAHTSLPVEFKERFFTIKEKQRMFDGQRTHSRLLLLDVLELTYPDWERDFTKAEEYHVSLPDLFLGKVSGMAEKQRMFEGNRSHPNLVVLDSLVLTYSAWAKDVAAAEDAHTSKPFMFREKIKEIKEKQKMFEGDRSHPRLVSLDAMRLTYDDWEKDVKKAEEYHVKFPELLEGKLAGMKEKQLMFNGDRSHPNLLELDSLTLNYSGYLDDVIKAEEAHTHMPLEFRGKLFEIKQKQRMHHGDRSHPRLVALDSNQFTFPGWERDVAKAEQYHVRFPELFEGKLEGIKEKQRIYVGRQAQLESLLCRNTNVLDNRSSSPGHNNECVVCLQNTKTHAFVPCGHLCVCEACVPATMSKRKCPICRQGATQAIKVFFA